MVQCTRYRLTGLVQLWFFGERYRCTELLQWCLMLFQPIGSVIVHCLFVADVVDKIKRPKRPAQRIESERNHWTFSQIYFHIGNLAQHLLNILDVMQFCWKYKCEVHNKYYYVVIFFHTLNKNMHTTLIILPIQSSIQVAAHIAATYKICWHYIGVIVSVIRAVYGLPVWVLYGQKEEIIPVHYPCIYRQLQVVFLQSGSFISVLRIFLHKLY